MAMKVAVVFYATVLGVASLGIVLRDGPAMISPDLPSLGSSGRLLVRALLGVAAGLSMVLASRLCHAWFRWARQLTDEFRLIFDGLSLRSAALMAVMGGVAEETLFRGLLLPSLGLYLSSLIFGIMHVGPSKRFVPWTVMAVLAGLLFGSLFQWTGSLVAPVVAHVVVNFVNLRLLSGRQTPMLLALDPVGDESLVRLVGDP